MGSEAKESDALIGRDVVVVHKTGFKSLGKLIAIDPVWITIEFQGERQLIPIASVDRVKLQ